MTLKLTDLASASCLKDLCARMNQRASEEHQARSAGVEFAGADFSKLPLFGGPAPRETGTVWSWDSTHQIVNDFVSGSWFKIVERADVRTGRRASASAFRQLMTTQEQSAIDQVALAAGTSQPCLRTDVHADVVTMLRPMLERALAGVEQKIAGSDPDCVISGARGGDCAILTVFASGKSGQAGQDGAPLLTIGIARGPSQARELWAMLQAHQAAAVTPEAALTTHAVTTQVAVTTQSVAAAIPKLPPAYPWCASLPEAGLRENPRAAHWLNEFERCLAWTFVETGTYSGEILRWPERVGEAAAEDEMARATG